MEFLWPKGAMNSEAKIEAAAEAQKKKFSKLVEVYTQKNEMRHLSKSLH